MTGTADGALLADAARRGDRAAFGRLYERYARLVHGLLLARVPPAEVDDLVQEVFLLALRRLETLRDAGAFGAWISAIARNRARDYHRAGLRQVELNDETSEGPPADVGPGGEAAGVLELIKGLPDAYRETLILRLVEGLTGPEIAARTGLTAGSVRVNLHRGMRQLREKLGKGQGS